MSASVGNSERCAVTCNRRSSLLATCCYLEMYAVAVFVPRDFFFSLRNKRSDKKNAQVFMPPVSEMPALIDRNPFTPFASPWKSHYGRHCKRVEAN